MQQKSNIQLICESIEFKNRMLNAFNKFTKQYTIEDNIFQYYNESICEVESGYFESVLESENMKDIISHYQNGMGIRIIGEKYQLGNIYKSITEAKNINKVLEIKLI